jgi:tRNA threonylcarbamoyl adenosine modification protein YeaZ
MKILAFDTSTSYAAIALCEDEHCRAEILCELGSAHSQKLLSQIENLLQVCNWKLGDLDALVVGVGPGSFTGLRVGIATAQALAFALQRDLYASSSLDALALNAPAGPSLLATCVDARKSEIYARLYRRGHIVANDNLQPPNLLHNLDTTAAIQPDAADIAADTKISPQPPDNSSNPMLLKLALPQALTPPMLLSPRDFIALLGDYDETALLLGNGAMLYSDQFAQNLKNLIVLPATTASHHLLASSLALLALPDIKQSTKSPPQSVQPIYIRPSEAEINVGPPEGGPPLRKRIAPDGSIC